MSLDLSLEALARSAERREAAMRLFHQRLRPRLLPHLLELLSETLGRNQDRLVWIVTCRGPRGIVTFHVPLERGQELYREETVAYVAEALIKACRTEASVCPTCGRGP